MFIFILLIVMVTSCSTFRNPNWENLSVKEKRNALVIVSLGVVYAVGMTYWIANPSDIPDNWPDDLR